MSAPIPDRVELVTNSIKHNPTLLKPDELFRHLHFVGGVKHNSAIRHQKCFAKKLLKN